MCGAKLGDRTFISSTHEVEEENHKLSPDLHVCHSLGVHTCTHSHSWFQQHEAPSSHCSEMVQLFPAVSNMADQVTPLALRSAEFGAQKLLSGDTMGLRTLVFISFLFYSSLHPFLPSFPRFLEIIKGSLGMVFSVSVYAAIRE